MSAPPDPWAEALLVARLFALRPLGTGALVRGRAGPVRDAFLAAVRAGLPTGVPWMTCSPEITDDRLLGGMDLGASLAGVVTARHGVLAAADGGVLVIRGGERMGADLAVRLGSVLDDAVVRAERDGVSLEHGAAFGLLVLDEGEEEQVPASLLDRLAFRVELDGIRTAPLMAGESPAWSDLECAPAMMEALCGTATALGIGSARAVLLAVRAARAVALLAGRDAVTIEDASVAARLVLAHRATQVPSQEPPPPETADEAEQDAAAPEPDEQAAADGATEVLEAARAALPERLLEPGHGAAGPAGSGRVGRPRPAKRGRPAGSRAGRPEGGARLHLVATLMAAAPWQRLRQASGSARIAVRGADLRVRRCVARPRQTTVFVVDASGSAALHRLAEAKGAVELLLAECYVGRNQVGLIAFRGAGAELLLPPTRALARARRCLSALPGGGGTPLAAGLSAAAELGVQLRRRGETPLLVVLTDGRGNVALDGRADRAQSGVDVLAVAGRVRAAGLPGLVLDISPRPAREAGALATAMGARYVPLPRADSAALSQAVKGVA